MKKFKASNTYRFIALALTISVLTIYLLKGESINFIAIIIFVFIILLVTYKSKNNYLLIDRNGFKEISSFRTQNYRWDEIEESKIIYSDETALWFKLKNRNQGVLKKVFTHGYDFCLINSYKESFEDIKKEMENQNKKINSNVVSPLRSETT
jgi:hypothetical protein